jgi:hypothetical protein
MGAALGRTIEAGEPPFEDWALLAGIPEGPIREGLARMYVEYDREAAIGCSSGWPGRNHSARFEGRRRCCVGLGME